MAMHTATAIRAGAAIWAGNSVMPSLRRMPKGPGIYPAPDMAPGVARRVPLGTRVIVERTTAFGGPWWHVQGGPDDGRLIAVHDPAWQVSPT